MDDRARKLALYARSMIPVISDVSPFMASTESSSDSSSKSGENEALNFNLDEVKNAMQSVIDAMGEFIEKTRVKIAIKGQDSVSIDSPDVKEEKSPKTRDELIAEYLKNVQKTIDNTDFQMWYDGKYPEELFQKLSPTAEDLNIRTLCIQQLQELDYNSGESRTHVVTKSQMELLGKLRIPVTGLNAINPKNFSDSQINLNSAEKILEYRKTFMTIYNKNTYFPLGWQADYQHDLMNEIFARYMITRGASLHHLFTQASNETYWGDTLLQSVLDIDKQGAGYVQLTSIGNYCNFLEYLVKDYYKATIKVNYNELNKSKIADIQNQIDELKTKCGSDFVINANIVDFSDITNENLGPALVAKLYPWQAACFYWTQNTFTYENKWKGYTMEGIIFAGGTINDVTNMMAGPNISEMRLVPGPSNYYQKCSLFAMSEGLFLDKR